jgi:hypothetical protein
MLTLATGAAAQPAGAPALDHLPLSVVQGAPRSAPMFDHAPMERMDGGQVCRDRIHQVREERGLPSLDRGNASADQALLIAAVDRRIDGCSVMVMRNNLADVRPLPTQEGEAKVQRIPGQ